MFALCHHTFQIDAHSMEIQYSLNISINHHKVGEMFIVCGVLYAIDSVTERNTTIRLALDLYQGKLLVSKFAGHGKVFSFSLALSRVAPKRFQPQSSEFDREETPPETDKTDCL